MSIMSVPARPAVAGESERFDPADVVVHDHHVVVDGLHTQYLEAGTGPTLLLLHGHEQSATGWRWVFPALALTHRVLALSLPGHGDTDPEDGAHAPGTDLAPFVTAFLDTLGVGGLDVVGHSAGGAVAARMALDNPDRIRTLSLVDSAGLGREVHPLLALDTLPGLGELAILISRLPGGNVGRSIMSAAMLFARPWTVPTEFFTEQHKLARRPGQLEASTAMARAMFGPAEQRQILLDRLDALTMPTLVMWGGCDYVLPVSHAHTAVRRLPQGRLALFPGCGHLPHVEQPARFATVLGAWLAETRPPQGVATSVRHEPVRAARRLGGLPQRGPRLRPAHRRLPAVARAVGTRAAPAHR